MLIGYARVSTTGQKLETQIEQLKNAGCERIYQEKRTGYDKMLKDIKPNDTLIVTSLDRLARSTHDLFEITKILDATDTHFKSLREHCFCWTFRTRAQLDQGSNWRRPAISAQTRSKVRKKTKADDTSTNRKGNQSVLLRATSTSVSQPSIASKTLKPAQSEILPFFTPFVRTGPARVRTTDMRVIKRLSRGHFSRRDCESCWAPQRRLRAALGDVLEVLLGERVEAALEGFR